MEEILKIEPKQSRVAVVEGRMEDQKGDVLSQNLNFVSSVQTQQSHKTSYSQNYAHDNQWNKQIQRLSEDTAWISTQYRPGCYIPMFLHSGINSSRPEMNRRKLSIQLYYCTLNNFPGYRKQIQTKN